jgi:hypothetical protein
MAEKKINCTFDRDAVWLKVRYQKPVVLDMNCWINMADDKSPLATRVKGVLQKQVADGIIFCPLSFGLIAELYKQAEDSRLRVGTLMEELSLNISYAIKDEIFAWEAERAIRRLADAGPLDISMHGLYVPILAYLTSRFHLEFPTSYPDEYIEEATKVLKQGMEAVSFTELLKMRAKRKDRIFDFVKTIPPPKFSEHAKRIRERTKGNKEWVRCIESNSVFNQYIAPVINNLPLDVSTKLYGYIK